MYGELRRRLPLILTIIISLVGCWTIQGQTQVTAQGADKGDPSTVFLICTWDTSSIFKDKTGKEKFERRFYVSPTVSMSKDEFLNIDRDGERIEGLCGNYLENTVILAAAERGERVDKGGTLTVIRNIGLSGENIGSKNMYSFATKEAVEKKRDEAVKEMISADRFIIKFNWDVTGKAEDADYANEKKRTVPTVVTKP